MICFLGRKGRKKSKGVAQKETTVSEKVPSTKSKSKSKSALKSDVESKPQEEM